MSYKHRTFHENRIVQECEASLAQQRFDAYLTGEERVMNQESYTELKQQREQLEKAMSRVNRKGYAYEVLYTEWRSINDRVLLIELEEKK